MSKAEMGKSQTNTDEGSCKELTMGCIPFWEQCQEEAIAKLASKLPLRKSVDDVSEYRIPGFGITIKPDKYFIIKDYEQRARKIASVYAQLYLETFNECSNINLKGRFHWMGLGVFASKTVAYVFSHWLTDFTKDWESFEYSPSPINAPDYTAKVDFPFKEAREMFACGNFWLYMEIAPWHIAWVICSESFDKCKDERDSRDFTGIKEIMGSLEWADYALPKIGFLALDNDQSVSKKSKTGTIEEAFKALTNVEAIFESIEDEQRKYQEAGKYLLENLIKFADNEQRNILQPIVWENESVRLVAEIQRLDVTGDVAPSTAIALSSDYHYSALKDSVGYHSQIGFYVRREMDERHRDVVPHLPIKPYLFDNGAKAENEESRMEYVTRIADTYHILMLDEAGRAFLHKEIAIIATWGEG